MIFDSIKEKVERLDLLLKGFQVVGKPSNIWNARNILSEVKSDLNNLTIIEHNQKESVPEFVG